MTDDRFPKRVMRGRLEGGYGCRWGQERDWMHCREEDLTFFDMEEEREEGVGWKTSAKEPK